LTNGPPVTRTQILKIAGGVAIVLVSFFATLVAIDLFGPGDELQKPELAQKPPLPEATRQSVVIAPVAIPIPALREAMEQAAPRNLSGVPDNQISKLLAKADIGFMLERSPLTLIGRADGLTIATSLNGSFRASGQLPSRIGERISGLLSERDKDRLSGALAGLLKEKDREKAANPGKDTRPLDQQANVKGDVHIMARPTITTGWRLEPNLVGQVKLAEANVQVAGTTVNAASEIKPMIDRAMSDQMLALGTRLRNDAFIENAARREWQKLCRSIALGSQGSGLPNLFLELRPTRAFAAQPRVDAGNVTLTLGIQADTRVVPEETKPDCPFPARLDIVPALDQGKVTIGLPIDVPFSELSKLLESQLKDKVFPDDRSSPAELTVLRALVSAAGDRLLVTLRVKARERKSWFGFGTEATVHISGKPVLDQNQQIVRLEEAALAVESDALFGLIGVAAKTAIPSLQAALERNAVVDLKPALANARRSIDKALSDFRQHDNDVRVDATMTGLRLVGIEFDSRIVRVTAEADGIARVAVNKLPGK
jgi:hypothetical protein